MDQVNSLMETQNLDKKEEALFEEVVSEEEQEDKGGSKRAALGKQRGTFKKAKRNYGKKSR